MNSVNTSGGFPVILETPAIVPAAMRSEFCLRLLKSGYRTAHDAAALWIVSAPFVACGACVWLQPLITATLQAMRSRINHFPHIFNILYPPILSAPALIKRIYPVDVISLWNSGPTRRISNMPHDCRAGARLV